MYAGWNLLLVVTLLCEHTFGFIWPFTAFAATFAHDGTPEETSSKKIAIIGAGAGGASAAYYLRKFAEKSGLDIEITVLERSSYIGGRSTTVSAYNNSQFPVELGGSIFIATNEILKNSSQEFGLNVSSSEMKETEVLGIWNGETFVHTMKDSGWQWWDTTKMLWKYGLAPIRTYRLMKTVVAKFKRLYEPPFFPFRSLSDRAEDLAILPVTSMTGERYLEKNGITGPFTTDIIQASTRVNYGQNLDLINGLETMVCMAIEGAMSIKGGNWQIFNGMIKSSNATVYLDRAVTAISKVKGKYSVKTILPDAQPSATAMNDLYDTVVLAAPYQYSNIDIEKGLLKHTPDHVPYVKLHVTLFTSNHTFSPKFFNLTPDVEVPTTILTTLAPNEVPVNPEQGVGKPGFFSISTLHSLVNPETNQKENLYKIFSPEPLTPKFLRELLDAPIPEDLTKIRPNSGGTITWYYPHAWHSYPYEYPRVTFEDSELAKGFYYTSGMDSFISSMESNALMGMNVAQLIVDDYLQILKDKEGAANQEPLQAVMREGEL